MGENQDTLPAPPSLPQGRRASQYQQLHDAQRALPDPPRPAAHPGPTHRPPQSPEGRERRRVPTAVPSLQAPAATPRSFQGHKVKVRQGETSSCSRARRSPQLCPKAPRGARHRPRTPGALGAWPPPSGALRGPVTGSGEGVVMLFRPPPGRRERGAPSPAGRGAAAAALPDSRGAAT